MGTRSLTYIYENYGLQDGETKPITCIYVQYDGYLEGVGTELADLLVNKYPKHNGMGCLAGLIICVVAYFDSSNFIFINVILILLPCVLI